MARLWTAGRGQIRQTRRAQWASRFGRSDLRGLPDKASSVACDTQTVDTAHVSLPQAATQWGLTLAETRRKRLILLKKHSTSRCLLQRVRSME